MGAHGVRSRGVTGAAALRTALRLGRVSNLPTVWGNTLAGAVLAGGAGPIALGGLVLAMSLAYVAGMYLNDAFDRDIDARERPERPIPAGEVRAATVFTAGAAMLALSVALVAGMALAGVVRGPAVGGAAALAGLVVLYDAWHKGNPAGPLVMGACRAAVYVTAALAVAGVAEAPVLVAAGLGFTHVAGLSLAAKTGRCGRAVAVLIAAIPALDALVLAVYGHPGAALVVLAAAPLTLAGQRWVRGT